MANSGYRECKKHKSLYFDGLAMLDGLIMVALIIFLILVVWSLIMTLTSRDDLSIFLVSVVILGLMALILIVFLWILNYFLPRGYNLMVALSLTLILLFILLLEIVLHPHYKFGR